METLEIRRCLQLWFKKNARDLPWRRSPTLYKTVVSEFMLQQTQVKTMLPFFERWLQQFPNFETLASAPTDEVVHAWEGLGYYSRAYYLQALAKDFIRKPASSYAELLHHKGIGPYTAAAIASLAFQEPVAVVDGNVVRVLARLFLQKKPFKTKDQALQWATPLAQSLLDPQAPGKFNEALMELGAVCCTKASATCDLCPLQHLCQAHQHHRVPQCPQFIPQKRRKRNIRRLWLKNAQEALLLETTQIGGAYPLWELPQLTHELEKYFTSLEPIFTGRRSIGLTDYVETILLGSINTLQSATLLQKHFPQARFFSHEDLRRCSISGPHRRWITLLEKQIANPAL